MVIIVKEETVRSRVINVVVVLVAMVVVEMCVKAQSAAGGAWQDLRI